MKAKYISVDEFIQKTEGKAYDFDHTAGVQCVDGIKVFNYFVYGDGADFNCGACGYAYGLWTNYETNGVKNYFDKYDFKDAKKGDWIIWNKGSKEAPKSHVAMFIERQANNRVNAYGQNQNGKKYFNFASISDNGILGVLRPKIYVSTITPNVEKDIYKNQIEVKVPELRVRTGAGTNKSILGYASKGYYNYYDTTEANGYKWYKIADGQWIASKDEWTTVYPAKPRPSDFFPPKGYFSEGDSSPNVGKIASFMRRCFPAYTSEKALGNYYGPYIKASIKEFQRRTGLEADGNVGPITLAKLKQYGFKP